MWRPRRKKIDQVTLQKKKKSNHRRELGQNQARRKHQAKDPNRGMERAPAEERSRAKGRGKTQPRTSKGKGKGKSSGKASK